MNRKKIFIAAALLFVFFAFSLVDSPRVMAASEDDVITKGIYIDSIDIGGMTVPEAEKAVENYIDSLRDKKITVNMGEHSETITLNKLDFGYAENNYAKEALNIGKTGNLIKRYKELKDVEETNLIYNLDYQVNDKKLASFIKNKCSIYDVPAANAAVKRENGEFVYTEHSIGRKVDEAATLDTIKNSLSTDWDHQNIVLDAVVVEDIPKYTLDLVKRCNAKLGTYSTTYETSSSDRAQNLANGARLINNTVLYPGDVFSGYEKLTPFTIENGYHMAHAYANGKVVDSIGGGACQVTTTLYNAVLLSELEVVERFPHSMTISYVDLSRDAAIAGTWKDLKFRNDTDVPILIEAYTYGRTITFNIWGEETRDTQNRKVKYKTVVLSEKQPGKDKVTKDPTKPITFKEITQPAYIGYVAELYKIVYENGVEVSRTRVNQSVYNATPREVTIGTKKEKPVKNTVDENTTDENTIEEKPDSQNSIENDNSSKGNNQEEDSNNSIDENTIDETIED